MYLWLIHIVVLQKLTQHCKAIMLQLKAALFITARTWKQPKCSSADEWIRKLRYIYTMEYYLAIKKNTFESVLMRWMKLELIIQREARKKNTNTVY